MIYNLRLLFSSIFTTAPSEMVALTTSRIYLMVYLIEIVQILTKYVIKLAQKKKNFSMQTILVVKHWKGRSKL